MCDTVGCGGGLKQRVVGMKTVLLVWTLNEKASVELQAAAERKVRLLEEYLRGLEYSVKSFQTKPNFTRTRFECRHIMPFAITADVILSLADDGLAGFGWFSRDLYRLGRGLTDRCVVCEPRSGHDKYYGSSGSTLLYDDLNEIVEFVRRC